MEAELRRRLEQAMGAAVDAQLADDDGATAEEDMAAQLLQSAAFVALREELAADARAAAAAVELLAHEPAHDAAEGAAEARRRRALLLQAVPPQGAIGHVLESLSAAEDDEHAAGTGGGRGAAGGRGLAEWWEGGEDGVLDLDALDAADSQGSLPPYEQLPMLAEQLTSDDAHDRASAHDALERYREHGLMGCPDWPAVCKALQLSLGDPVPELAERALGWHEELFAIATGTSTAAAAAAAGGQGGGGGNDEDAEVTQCADIFNNLTQHLLSCFRPPVGPDTGGGGGCGGGCSVESVAGVWHRSALGIVEAGWSLIHEPSIYEFVGATAQLMAIPEAMCTIAAISYSHSDENGGGGGVLWFRRWVMAMHRRGRTFNAMAQCAPTLGQQLLSTLAEHYQPWHTAATAAAAAAADSEVFDSRQLLLLLRHTVDIVSALMLFPEGGAALLSDNDRDRDSDSNGGGGGGMAAVRDGAVGVRVMKLVCGVREGYGQLQAMPSMPDANDGHHRNGLLESCAETLQTIAQRHPAANSRRRGASGLTPAGAYSLETPTARRDAPEDLASMATETASRGSASSTRISVADAAAAALAPRGSVV